MFILLLDSTRMHHHHFNAYISKFPGWSMPPTPLEGTWFCHALIIVQNVTFLSWSSGFDPADFISLTSPMCINYYPVMYVCMCVWGGEVYYRRHSIYRLVAKSTLCSSGGCDCFDLDCYVAVDYRLFMSETIHGIDSPPATTSYTLSATCIKQRGSTVEDIWEGIINGVPLIPNPNKILAQIPVQIKIVAIPVKPYDLFPGNVKLK